MEQMKVQVGEIQTRTARIDERVQVLVEVQSELTQRFIKLTDWYTELTQRVSLLETRNYDELRRTIQEIKHSVHQMRTNVTAIDTQGPSGLRNKLEELGDTQARLVKKLEVLEDRAKGAAGVLSKFGGMAVQLVWLVSTCWLLYKFGLN